MYPCYDNIFGLSQADCDCFDPKPANYNTSNSGLFLDELYPLDDLEGYKDCTNSDVWKLMENARSEAIRIFVARSNALLASQFRLAKQSWKGILNLKDGRGYSPQTSGYAGLRLRPFPLPSGAIKITNIGAIFEQTGTKEIDIYDIHGDSVLDAPLTLDTLAGKWNGNIQDITLPSLAQNGEPTEYFILYQIDTSRAKKNTLGCGCNGFSPRFDIERPYYSKVHSGSRGWASWAMVAGVHVDATEDIPEQAHCNTCFYQHAYGLTLNIEFSCKVDETICKDDIDFATDPLGLSIAFAVRYIAADLLAEKLLKSTVITRQNLINREVLQESRKEWNGKLADYMDYIIANANINQSGCFVCNSNFRTQIGQRLS